MFKKLMSLAIAVVFAGASASFAAQSYGSKDEAMAMVKNVAAQYEAEGFDATAAAIMDTENATYHDRDLYAFIIDFDGVMRAHGVNPKLVDRNLIELKDPQGRFFIKDMLKLATNGDSGWVQYQWTNPETKKFDSKASYVVPLDNGMFAAVGVYDN